MSSSVIMLIIFAARLLCMLARKCSCDPIIVPCNFKDIHCSLRDNCNSSKENVALGKQTRFRSVFQIMKHRGLDIGSVGCLAVNGNIDPHYRPARLHEAIKSSNCFRSGETDRTPYWEVDLGRTYTVTEITIVVDSAHRELMLNVEVHVNDRLCYKFTSVTIVHPYMTHIRCKSAISGRIVKLSKRSPPDSKLTPDIMMSFCEVQVWVCNHGLYGRNCDKKCSKSCNNCDNFVGECESCETGYYGIYCTALCRCSKKGCNRDGSCLETPTTPAPSSFQRAKALPEATNSPGLPGPPGSPELSEETQNEQNTAIIVSGVVAGIFGLCFIAGGLHWFYKTRAAAEDDYTKIPPNGSQRKGSSRKKGSKRKGSSRKKERSKYGVDLNITENSIGSTRDSNGSQRKKGRSRYSDDLNITENSIGSTRDANASRYCDESDYSYYSAFRQVR